MDLIKIAKAAAPFTTAVSVVALVAMLFAYIMLRHRERSIRAMIVGDSPVGARDVVRILNAFKDDHSRLRALQQVLSNDSSTAKEVLERAKNYDVALAAAHSRTQYLTRGFVVGSILLLMGMVGILARAIDNNQVQPDKISATAGSIGIAPANSAMVASMEPSGIDLQAETRPANDDTAASLILEVWGTVRGSKDGPLQNRTTLRSGDRIQLTARPSASSYLYVLYCNVDGTLSVYPPTGTLSMRAGSTRVLPGDEEEFLLDKRKGKEVVYVLGSRRLIDDADPKLGQVLSRARGAAGNSPACGDTLESILADRGRMLSTRQVEASRRPVASSLRGVEVVAKNPTAGETLMRAAAGSDGIVIIRLELEHR